VSINRIGGLVAIGETEQAKKEIVDAFVAAKGDRSKAAEILNASVRSVYNWLDRIPGAWKALDDALAENDIERPAGPPRGIDKLVEAVVAARGSINPAARELGITNKKLVAEIERHELMGSINEGLRKANVPRTNHLSARRLKLAA
jgi:hypothetical protein